MLFRQMDRHGEIKLFLAFFCWFNCLREVNLILRPSRIMLCHRNVIHAGHSTKMPVRPSGIPESASTDCDCLRTKSRALKEISNGGAFQTAVALTMARAGFAFLPASVKSFVCVLRVFGFDRWRLLLYGRTGMLTHLFSACSIFSMKSAGTCNSSLVVQVTQVLVDHTDNDLASGSARRRILDG
jgi:hypothetical protein